MANPVKPDSATTDPLGVRLALIGITLLFLSLFLFLPVLVVFHEAFRHGLGAYFAAITDRDALSAIRLTLMTAGIAVPLNVAFGLAASRAIARFTFPGKQTLITLIDLPFSVSPVISGMIFVLFLGVHSPLGGLLY